MGDVYSAVRNRIAQLFAITVTIVLVALFLTLVTPADIITTLMQINPLCLAAGFIFYLGVQYMRTWRFHLLLNREISIRELVPVEFLHVMFVNLLPVRTGELSYVYFLKTECKRTTGEGLATLVIARIFDCIVVSVSFILTFFLIRHTAPLVFSNLITLCVVFVMMLVVVLTLSLLYGSRCLTLLKKTAGFFNYGKVRLGDYFIKKGEEIIDSIEKFKACRRDLPFSILVITAGIWIGSYTFFLLLAVGINIPLGYQQILFASIFAMCTSMIPLQGIAGFGTTEGGWALGFIAMGLPSEMAISSGFVIHIVNLLFGIFLGVFGYFTLRFSKLLPRKKGSS
jgi:uncharacterized protein (TIRG00374 family)